MCLCCSSPVETALLKMSHSLDVSGEPLPFPLEVQRGEGDEAQPRSAAALALDLQRLPACLLVAWMASLVCGVLLSVRIFL